MDKVMPEVAAHHLTQGRVMDNKCLLRLVFFQQFAVSIGRFPSCLLKNDPSAEIMEQGPNLPVYLSIRVEFCSVKCNP